MDSNVESLLRRHMRDRSISALGHAIGIDQLTRPLNAARRHRTMLPFPELEMILTRLEGADLFDLVEAFARDAGCSLEPRAGRAARAVADMVGQMEPDQQQRALRLVQALLD